jgi:hypothetical protein
MCCRIKRFLLQFQHQNGFTEPFEILPGRDQMTLIPAAHGGKRPQWITTNASTPITRGAITRFSKCGKRSMVGTDDNGIWVDREPQHELGLEIEVSR